MIQWRYFDHRFNSLMERVENFFGTYDVGRGDVVSTTRWNLPDGAVVSDDDD